MAPMARPTIVVDNQTLKRILNHDAWVYQDQILRGDTALPPGEPVDVAGSRGPAVAVGFYNPRSHIPLRILSLDPSEVIGPELFRRRLERALARRRDITSTTARRLVYSEADGLPGLIVDQYGRWLVLQLRTAGMDRHRHTLVELLRELVQPDGILERSDKEFRSDEALPPVTQLLHGEVPERITIDEGGLRYQIDPHGGLKTGFYLDQRSARTRLRQVVRPGQRVADVFSYTGGFGVAAAAAEAHVTCVEQDERFVEQARANARLNHLHERMEFVAANAFYWLQAEAEAGVRFDWVVLDPPGLVKARADVRQGRQALHHLVSNALGLLAPGGSLAVSICTYHLLGLTEEIVRIAAAERGQRLWVREQWLQAPDHPWILQMPATHYLTTWWMTLDAQSAGSPTS
jgi:23S rRNA (cytosine1962-C5)-methyltransferase